MRYTSQNCRLFWKFRETLFHSLEMQTTMFGRTEYWRSELTNQGTHTNLPNTRTHARMIGQICLHTWQGKRSFLLHKTWRKAIIILYITSGLTYIFHLSYSTFIILSLYVHPFLSLLVANSKLLSYSRIKSPWFNLYTAITNLWYREIVAIIREQMPEMQSV